MGSTTCIVPRGPPVTILDSLWIPRVSGLSSTSPISRQLRVAPNSPASLSGCPQEGKSRCAVRLCPRLNVGDPPGSVLQFPHRKHGGENQISESHPLPPLAQPEDSSTVAFPSSLPDVGFLGSHVCREGHRRTSPASTRLSAVPAWPPCRSGSLLRGLPLADPSVGPALSRWQGRQRQRQLLLSLLDDMECKFCWQHSLLPLRATSFNHRN